MNEKELRKNVIGKNTTSNVLLAVKIILDLGVQVLLVYLIGGMIAGDMNGNKLLLIFSVMVICYGAKGAFHYGETLVAHNKAYSKLTELRLRIIDHLKKLNLGFFKEHNAGELTNIVQHDVEQVEVYLAHGLPQIMSATLLPILIFVGMIVVDYRLALVMVTGVPLMLLVKVLSQKSMKRNFKKYFDQESKMREELMEYVKNIATIKAFAKEEDISKRTLKTARGYIAYVKKSMGSVTLPMGLIDIFMEVGVVLVMITGTFLLAAHQIRTPEYILAMILSSAFTAAISKTATLQHFSIVFREALKGIGKILTVPTPGSKVEAPIQPGEIRFRDVNFAYEKDSFQLEDINLSMRENSLNALVGPSGCGKSTLANLLMGFWETDRGKITIGGEDISRFSGESISALVGSVQQEVILFNMSVYDNIAMGKSDASKNEVVAAAKKARCHGFISSLPNGYDTKVGEMGVKLSGGEKQRISIARMILKNAPILVLDEAMAAVDGENERLIGEAIEALRGDKTVVTIAHHLNTVRDADQIIVMDRGRILDKGCHEELMRRCDFYRHMVTAQNKVDGWNLKEEAV